MTNEKLSEVIGMIDEDIIAAAEKSRAEVRRSKKKPLWIGVCSTAACAALITAVALTDPASYLSGESIVDPEYAATSSATTHSSSDDKNAGSITEGAETIEIIETTDGVDICTGEAAATTDGEPPEHGGAADGTCDAPAAIETADIVVDDVPDSEEAIDDTPIIDESAPVTGDAPEDVEEVIPVTGDAPEDVEEVIPVTGDAPENVEEVIPVTGDAPEEVMTCDAPEYIETGDVAEETGDVTEEADIIKVDSSYRRYENVELMEQSVTGAPQSYEELHDYLSVHSDSLNFIQYKITAQYTPEEAYALTGDDIYIYATTLYQAKATYDLLNGKPLDYSFFLCDAGTAEEQIEGMPLLSVGERYASVLTGGGKDRQYVAFPELTFAIYRQGAEDYAYHLRFDRIRFIKSDGTDIDLGVSADEEYIITSTGNNPVHYVHKYELSELADFFRADWTKREYRFPPLFEITVPIE